MLKTDFFTPSSDSPIPILNLGRQYLMLRDEFLEAMNNICEKSQFIGGAEVTKFEQGFSAWVGAGFFSCGVANGTDAITLAAKALRIPEGSQAILPAMTYFATAEGLLNAGIDVKLVDITPDTWLLDVDQIESAWETKVKLVVPVHLYGQMVPMDRIQALTESESCFILEDASQAHGANWKAMPVGFWGDIATYSLYPGKNLGAFGDAGIVLSRNKEWIEAIRILGNHGGTKKFQHDQIAFNSRLDGLQAAVLNVKLKYIDEWNEKRRKVALKYEGLLSKISGLTLPTVDPDALSVYHQYVVLVENRESFVNALAAKGVQTGIHYPEALHQLKALGEKFKGQKFPNAERVARCAVSLPMCPTLTDSEIDRVTQAVRDYFNG